jgi:hypothetical protein
LPFKLLPFSGSRRTLEVDVAPDRAGDVAEALRDLVGQLPDHPAIVPVTDAGVADGHPFVTVAAPAGQTLDAALREYGPAEIADALPRLRRLADALDFASAHGQCHDALTPQHVIIAADDTYIEGIGVAAALWQVGLEIPQKPPYAAPEIVGGHDATTRSDQFSLASIAHEWLFGRLTKGPADDNLALPSLPGVNGEGLRRAFMTALARNPADRFESCTAFVDALDQSARLPKSQRSKVQETPKFWAAAALDDMRGYPSEARVAASPVAADAVARVTPRESRRGLVAALVVGGIALGVLGIWLARRSNDAGRAADIEAGQPFTDAQIAPPGGLADKPASMPVSPAPPAIEPPVVPAAKETALEGQRRGDIDARPAGAPGGMAVGPAAQVDAGLLVHSTPAGAAVSIDGIERGTTPVAVRGLPLGTRTVVVTRVGYRPSERQITLTADRPSRTVEVGLIAVPASSQSRSPVQESGLVVDSRPAGASVSIDGRPAGVTPLTLPLAPGTYTVRIERAGYRTVTTSVEVNSGQRARVAARLEGGQNEE